LILLWSDFEDIKCGFVDEKYGNEDFVCVTHNTICEKSHEHNIDLYNIFVHYTHAFDSVYRNKLIECLKKFDVSDKLIRLIAVTLKNTRSRVKINKDYIEEFIVKCGVKLGDPLSATLFSLVIDTVLKQMELKEKYYHTPETMYCLCR
jgi:hypothetical protein